MKDFNLADFEKIDNQIKNSSFLCSEGKKFVRELVTNLTGCEVVSKPKFIKLEQGKIYAISGLGRGKPYLFAQTDNSLNNEEGTFNFINLETANRWSSSRTKSDWELCDYQFTKVAENLREYYLNEGRDTHAIC